MSQTTRASAPARSPGVAGDGSFTHRQILTIIVGLMVGMFLAALDQTVVSTAIRTIADDLDGFDLQAWATTSFLITSTITTPLYGKLSDIYGRRPFYLFAIGAFVVGSLLCGISTSMYELAVWRAVQGIGAGGLMSLALAIIGDIVPPRERSRYQGYFMAVFGSSSVLGPVVGGFLAGQDSLAGLAGWRWIFWLNVPLGILAFVVVMHVLHLPHERREHRIDWPGALALVVFLVPMLIVAEQGRIWGWADPRSVTCYAVGAVGFALFLLAERHYGDDAMLPLRLFANRSLSIAGAASVMMGAGMFGSLLLLPLYLQVVQGSSATEAGLQMIPLVAGIMVGGASAGIAISRTGRYKVFPLVGTALMTGALLGMSLVVQVDTPYGLLVPFMVVLGLGLGWNFQPVIIAVQNAAAPREMGVATSSVAFFRQIGGTIGTAVFLSILITRLPVEIGGAFRDAGLDASGGGIDLDAALSDTTQVAAAPAPVVQAFGTGFSHAVDTVLLLAAGVVALGFFVLLFLPQLALSDQSGIQARQAADEAAAKADGSTATGDPTTADVARAAGAAAPTSVSPAPAPPPALDGGPGA